MDQDWTNAISFLICGGIPVLIGFYLHMHDGYAVLKDKVRSWGFKFEYQIELVSFLIIGSISFICFFPAIGIVMHNIPAWVGFVFVVCYPWIVMILRSVTFRNVWNIYSHIRVYAIFFVFSFYAGGFFTMTGFSMFNFNVSWELGVVTVFIGLIGQTIPLLPDYIEKVTGFDLGMNRESVMISGERIRALAFMGGLSFATFLILVFIQNYIQTNIFGI